MSVTTVGVATAAPVARRGRRAALGVVGLAVSAVFVYVAARGVSLAELQASFSGASYVWLAPALVLTYATLFLRALRWRLLFVDASALTRAQSFGALNLGLALNNVLPWRAGELARVLAVRRATGLSAFEIGATIVVERVLDVFIVALAGLCLAPWLPERPWIDALVVVCAGLVAAIVVGVAVLVLLRRVAAGALARVPFATELRAGARVLVRPRRLAAALALTAAVWGVAGLSCVALVPAFGLDWGSPAPWLALVANTLAITIPSSPGTIGVYEAPVQASLVAYGAPAEPALAYALVLHGLNFLPILLTGALAGALLARR